MPPTDSESKNSVVNTNHSTINIGANYRQNSLRHNNVMLWKLVSFGKHVCKAVIMQNQVMGGWSGWDRDTVHSSIRHWTINILKHWIVLYLWHNLHLRHHCCRRVFTQHNRQYELSWPNMCNTANRRVGAHSIKHSLSTQSWKIIWSGNKLRHLCGWTMHLLWHCFMVCVGWSTQFF